MASNAAGKDAEARLIEATHEAITRFGVDRFTVADVARLANMSRQNLYRYFRNKEDLLAGLAAHMERTVENGIEELIHRDENLETRLYAIAEYDDSGFARTLLHAEPKLVLDYFLTRRGDSRVQVLMEEALDPFLRQAEQRTEIAIDRKLLVELIERLRVSLYLFPSTDAEFARRAVGLIVESVLADPQIWAASPPHVDEQATGDSGD